MNEVAEKIDTSKIKLPGSLSAPTVSGAPDELLADEIEHDLGHIKKILEPKGLALDNEKLPDGYEARFTRGETNNLFAVERAVKRLHACRQELSDRKIERARKHTAELKDARESLERVITEGASYLDMLSTYAADLAPAQARMRQFVADVHAVTGAKALAENYQRTQSAIRTAACALGKPTSELSEPPKDMPTHDDVDSLLYVIRGIPKGNTSELPRPPKEVHHADKNARTIA